MDKLEFRKLISRYGHKKARAARVWFINNHSFGFRQAVKQADYCTHNEYLWNQ